MSARKRGPASIASFLICAYVFLGGAVPAFAQVMTISLDPPNATNPVGTAHTVTATVTDGGSPVAGVSVHFDVEGDGTPTPASGDATTDGNGEATFAFTNAVVGSSNTITACIDSNQSETCGAGLSFVGSSSAAAPSVGLPTHQTGDLLLMFAYRNDDAVPPPAPAGWSTVGTGSNNGQSEHTAFKVATSSSEVSGTWTGATHLAVLVYRGADATPIGNTAVASDNNSSTITFQALALQGPGSSWVAGLAGHRNATDMNIAPAGMTNRTGGVRIGAHDTAGSATSWPATDVTYNQGGAYRSRTVEVLGESAEAADTATKTWEAGPAVNIALDPQTDTNPVGTDHDVTATVTDEFGNPVEDEAVHYDVTGEGAPTPSSGDATTDTAGEATFTFTNQAPGTNTITGCLDADASQSCEVSEAADTATKTWMGGPQPPPATCPGFESDPRNHVVGTTGNDALTGTPGDDVICGLDGNDTIDGGSGNDLILGGSGADLVRGGSGNDVLRGDAQNDVLRGGPDKDRLVGGPGRDSLRGAGDKDRLNGGPGRDKLSGGGGNDRLDGGPGTDFCRGGGGVNVTRKCER